MSSKITSEHSCRGAAVYNCQSSQSQVPKMLINWSSILVGGLNGRLALVELNHMVQSRYSSAPRVLAIVFASVALLVSVVAGLGSILALLLPMDLSVDHWFQ